MGLSKLGKYIQQSDLRNKDNAFSADSVVGLSTAKEMIATKADMESVKSVSSYKVFPPKHFAFVPDTSRRGDKMSLAYNSTDETYLVSSISVVFYVSDVENISSDYLFMYFNRPEFDRYARYNSWGSAREAFSWDDMCDIEINLPDLAIQQKYVNIYKAMAANQQAYEKGLDDLKLTCDAYIENLRREMPLTEIGEFLERKNDRNSHDNKHVLGLSTTKEFRVPQSRVKMDNLLSYKVVKKNEFAFVPTTDTWKVFAFGLNSKFDEIVVSPIYEVFAVNENKLFPEYLAMWLKREEFDRYARYHSGAQLVKISGMRICKRSKFRFQILKSSKTLSQSTTPTSAAASSMKSSKPRSKTFARF